MDRDKLIQRLRATFLLELREHVEAFNRELLALERETADNVRAESIKTLFRTAHSLKGASRAVNATKLEAVCHKLEELLAALREGKRELTPDIFEQLFAAVDTFEVAGREFAAASQPAPTATSTPAVGTRSTPQPAAAKPPPAVSPSPPPKAAEPKPSPPPVVVSAPPAISVNAPPSPTDVPDLEPIPPLISLTPIPGAGVLSEAPSAPPSLEGLVRVPERKLDSLLSASGALLLARRRLDARAAGLAELHQHLAELRASLQRRERNRSTPARGNGHGNGQAGNGGLQVVTPAAAAAHTPAAARAIDPSRHALQVLENAVENYGAGLQEDLRSLDRAAEALDERIHQVRMVPFSDACDALFRTVRDLSTRERKPVLLSIEGSEIELDRSIVDGLRSPLLHLVRNAIDHGVESADERAAAGKPPRSRLTITAALRGDLVEVTVRDDGRGIDLHAIRDRLRRRGLDVPDAEPDLLRTIFEAGFTTAPTVTDVSGRGVGLDVVRSQVEAMRGSVAVTFKPGAGTCFSLTLPLTVTTLRALLVRTGRDAFAIPSASVVKLVRADARQLALVQGREMLISDGAPLPLVSLAEMLGLEADGAVTADSKLPIVILDQSGTRLALSVDELIAEQDVVVKPLGKRVRRLRHVSGATILPSGRIALLLHPGDLARSALARMPARRASAAFATDALPARKRILLVDDSATTRALEKSILEAAGHEVVAAVDGSMGWQLLQESGADIVVSDVEMPNMNGFVLTQTIRSSKRFRDLPVILLTSLESEQDRARGLEAGANAYLVKSAFDQTHLLDTIRQLL